MKAKSLALCLLCFSQIALADYTFTAPKGWKSTPVKGLKEFWVDPKTKGSALNLLVENSPEPLIIPVNEQKVFFTKLMENRKKTLGALGIKNYSVDKHQFDKAAGGVKLRLLGHYELSKMKLSFVEDQYYIGKTYYQLNISWQKGLDFKSATSIAEGLRVKP